MKNALVALFCGLLFALGLGLSGMTLPAKVVGFLDLFGDWDPSLAFVMAGAIGVHAGVMHLARRSRMCQAIPAVAVGAGIDRSLLLGAVLFGIGWGLVGYCPGPAIVGVVSFDAPVLIVVASMIVGMLVFHRGALRTGDRG